MKNTIKDLNNHLFAQLENLTDVKSQNIEFEVKRTRAMVSVAKSIVSNNRVNIEGLRLAEKSGFVITDNKFIKDNFEK